MPVKQCLSTPIERSDNEKGPAQLELLTNFSSTERQEAERQFFLVCISDVKNQRHMRADKQGRENEKAVSHNSSHHKHVKERRRATARKTVTRVYIYLI